MSAPTVKSPSDLKFLMSAQDATNTSSKPLREDEKENIVLKTAEPEDKEDGAVNDAPETVTEPPVALSESVSATNADPGADHTARARSNSPRSTPSLDEGTPVSSSTIWSSPTPPPLSTPSSSGNPRALRRNDAVIFSWAGSDNESDRGAAGSDMASDVGEGESGSNVRAWSELQETDGRSDEVLVLPPPKSRERSWSNEEVMDYPTKRRKLNTIVKKKLAKGSKGASGTSRARTPKPTSLPTPPSTPQTYNLRPRK